MTSTDNGWPASTGGGVEGSHLVRLPGAASGPGAGFSSKTDFITSFWEVSCSVCTDNYLLSTYFVQSLLLSLHTLLLGHKLCHQIDSQGDKTSTRTCMLPSATCCVVDTPGVDPSVGIQRKWSLWVPGQEHGQRSQNGRWLLQDMQNLARQKGDQTPASGKGQRLQRESARFSHLTWASPVSLSPVRWNSGGAPFTFILRVRGEGALVSSSHCGNTTDRAA